MVAVLSLDGWGDIAQFVIAISAVVALFGAAAQLRQSRTSARRSRVYEYADRFNTRVMLRRATDYRAYWDEHDFADFRALSDREQLDRLLLPNLIEEIAYLYNRKLLDRRVAVDLLRVYVERMWEASRPLIDDVRKQEESPVFYSEWERMYEDIRVRMERRK